MNPRSLLTHHLPTLTEVIDEASIADRGIAVDLRPGAPAGRDPDESFEHRFATGPDVEALIDLSDPVPVAYRTPTPQEVDRLLGDESPFEATISDRDIRRALAELKPGEAAAVDPAPAEPGQVDRADLDETQLTQRVLIDVQRQVDAILEHRLRETLLPVLARVADDLASEARDVLASSLRDLVRQAVAQEIERQRGR